MKSFIFLVTWLSMVCSWIGVGYFWKQGNNWAEVAFVALAFLSMSIQVVFSLISSLKEK